MRHRVPTPVAKLTVGLKLHWVVMRNSTILVMMMVVFLCLCLSPIQPLDEEGASAVLKQ